jgi:hypothetical protein
MQCALDEHASDVGAHLLQGLGEQDIESTATFDEYLGESGACDY